MECKLTTNPESGENILTISIPLDEQGTLSSSGKSIIVANTGGYIPSGIRVQGKLLKLSVVGLIPADK